MAARGWHFFVDAQHAGDVILVNLKISYHAELVNALQR